MTHQPLTIIGGGLAGSEAAWQAAERGIDVVVHEMRPLVKTPVHHTDALAELVCSNSFRSDDAQNNAVGVLHAELRACGSLIMDAADTHKLPAGGALAVDREGFSAHVSAAVAEHPRITIRRREIVSLPKAVQGLCIVATGPLTSCPLAKAIQDETGTDALAFFDAIAPIVYRDSVDMNVCWFQSRYDKAGPGGDGADYLNCPLDEAQYAAFIAALRAGETAAFRDWETNTPYFEGCLPIEVMAARGPDTLRYGPMKPVGLTNPHRPDAKPHAVVQLRQDNALGTLWNMVGFQTKLTYGAQKRIFRLIPGLGAARFARLGGIHRNTFLDSPRLLDGELRLKSAPHVRFAGQITGVEGYVESAASGLLAGRFAAAQIRNEAQSPPAPTTALGSLLAHVTGGHMSAPHHSGDGCGALARHHERQGPGPDPSPTGTFQPMNINFGLFPPIPLPRAENGKRIGGKEKKFARRRALAARALRDIAAWA